LHAMPSREMISPTSNGASTVPEIAIVSAAGT
jgi:hypothetical protein